MTDSAFLRLLFRQHPDPLENFCIHVFLFVFLEADDEEDIFYYDISCGEFNMTFVLAKIETTGNCNPSSNLDFVHFIWTNYERFTFGKYCLTFIPRDEPDLPRLVCLKHHRAESEGWRNDIHCPACHQVSEQFTSPGPLSTSQQLSLFHLRAAASLPTRFRIAHTLSDGS